MTRPTAPQHGADSAMPPGSANGPNLPLTSPHCRGRPSWADGIRIAMFAGLGALILLAIFMARPAGPASHPAAAVIRPCATSSSVRPCRPSAVTPCHPAAVLPCHPLGLRLPRTG